MPSGPGGRAGTTVSSAGLPQRERSKRATGAGNNRRIHVAAGIKTQLISVLQVKRNKFVQHLKQGLWWKVVSAKYMRAEVHVLHPSACLCLPG